MRVAWVGRLLWLLLAASAPSTALFDELTWTVAGQPVRLLRSNEGSALTLSASCRNRTGLLACQAFSVLTTTSRRMPEARQHGVGGFDCPDFHAARVEPSDGATLCRFADGSLIKLDDLDAYAREKDAWEEALSDPAVRQLPRFAACLERVQWAAVGALTLTATIDPQGHLLEPRAVRPKSRGADWPRAEKCVLAAFDEIKLQPPPAFVQPYIELHLMLGGEPRVDRVVVTWKLASVRVRIGKAGAR
ncbi:MAG TPA: hypothetical protein VKN99_21895 [Polyangia bacterium]|nr:hypothetical protein [Polyangia bacterium]